MRMKVVDCPAGPVLDAAVARVLGDYIEEWSVDIDVAWDLVEKAHLSIWCTGGFGKWAWGAGYWRRGDLLCWSRDLGPETCPSPISKTAPLAITRAFLLAHGVEHIET